MLRFNITCLSASAELTQYILMNLIKYFLSLQLQTEQFDEQQGTRGDLIIGLKFELQEASKNKGTLHVLVKEAKNLVATKPNGLADVFCKR